MPVPVPGLRGIEHMGLTVPDMDRALAFFHDVLGAKTLYETGPFKAEDNWMAVNLGVAADAVIPRLVMIRIADGPCLELFEYTHADQRDTPPRNSDVGGHHLALYVDDIDEAVAAAKGHGLKVQGEPKIVDAGPSQGLRWVYFQASWGLQLEFVSYPSGIAAYRDIDPPVWRP